MTEFTVPGGADTEASTRNFEMEFDILKEDIKAAQVETQNISTKYNSLAVDVQKRTEGIMREFAVILAQLKQLRGQLQHMNNIVDCVSKSHILSQSGQRAALPLSGFQSGL